LPEFGEALVAGGPETDAVITAKNEMTKAGTANDLKPTRAGVLFLPIDLPLSLSQGPVVEAPAVGRI
jgi:hypothetical protein